jgi:hypothetical protein
MKSVMLGVIGGEHFDGERLTPLQQLPKGRELYSHFTD